ncbi:hypothetical protein QO002_005705 [Pararhizobium capsulatum DSM 1112]|uniref:DUF982 domain-containing protein n=1 Tax=Pararhizobium capsulatum DSM 1112 TaxID=1121113 RepID=A0ABU0C0M8_9HYPH|nr:DUF982 domain-containing protein [Pararhizobium capsulatum]MDQ0323499.1 hypothetical protein [Pararhizobium capsulatum DSM 1112]
MVASIWDTNVEVMLECSDHFLVIKSAREAVSCLRRHWPKNKGLSYAQAKRVCLEAARGTTPNAEARAAFEAAAEEAGILRRF